MDDDDKTVIRPPQPAFPGDDAPSVFPDLRAEPLPPGARVHEFVIESTIAFGGFGIVYLARDELLGREVALKEYLPESLAYRASDVSVRVRSSGDADTFAVGLESFIKEARTLASFDDPALVKVYQFWRENGTAYMVMPYYRGPTLKQALAARKDPPDEAWLRGLLDALLNALEVLHKEHWYHRDVAPDNILLVNGSVPVLLDFGAARRVIEDRAKTLTVILKPGYAPVEQYGEAEGMSQGPWTDLYALAAVMYFAIVGRAPPPSVSRAVRDTIQPLSELVRGRFSAPFLRTIDKALSLHPEDRPQSVAEFRAMLGAAVPPTGPTGPSNARDGGGAVGGGGRGAQPATESGNRKAGAIAGLAVLGVAGIAAAVYGLMGGRGTAGTTSAPAVAAASAPAAPPAFAPAPAAASPATSPATSPALAPVAPAAPAATPLPADPLEALLAARDPAFDVQAAAASPTARIGRDSMRITVKSARAGHVYLFVRGTRDELMLLFPNRADRRNRIEAGQAMTLPSKSWTLTAGGPAGTNRFVAVVSESPRDFGAAGAQPVDIYLSFAEEKLRTLAGGGNAARAMLVGDVKCAAGAPCPESYGAAPFEVREVP